MLNVNKNLESTSVCKGRIYTCTQKSHVYWKGLGRAHFLYIRRDFDSCRKSPSAQNQSRPKFFVEWFRLEPTFPIMVPKWPPNAHFRYFLILHVDALQNCLNVIDMNFNKLYGNQYLFFLFSSTRLLCLLY